MEKDEKAVEAPVEPAATTETPAAEVNYQALLDATLIAQAKVEEERDNYKAGLLKAKGKIEGEDPILPTEVDIDRIVDAAVAKKLNSFQSEMADTTMESLISSYTTDPAKAKLIKLNWQNKVLKEGSLAEQVENAVAITDRQAILTTNKELAVALTNRSQLSNASMGAHTETPAPKDNFFSQEQLAELKQKGWDDAKIELLKKNMTKVK